MGGSIYGGSLHGGSIYLWEGVGWGAGEGRLQRRWLACARAREDWGVCVRACVRTSVSTSVDLNKFAGETEDWGVCVRACLRARLLACSPYETCVREIVCARGRVREGGRKRWV